MRPEIDRALQRIRYEFDRHGYGPGSGTTQEAVAARNLVERELADAWAALPREVGAGAPLGEATLAERIRVLDAAFVRARLRADRLSVQLRSAAMNEVDTQVSVLGGAASEVSAPSGTMADVTAPPAEPEQQSRRDGHVPLVHPRGYHDGQEFDSPCQFCDGGLFACTVCGSFEGATTDMCPGREMLANERDNVYAGLLNYRLGEWRRECALIRMPMRTVAEQQAAGKRVAELENEADERDRKGADGA